MSRKIRFVVIEKPTVKEKIETTKRCISVTKIDRCIKISMDRPSDCITWEGEGKATDTEIEPNPPQEEQERTETPILLITEIDGVEPTECINYVPPTYADKPLYYYPWEDAEPEMKEDAKYFVVSDSIVKLKITNYNEDFDYDEPTASGGSVTRDGDTLTWEFGTVSQGSEYTVSIRATEEGKLKSFKGEATVEGVYDDYYKSVTPIMGGVRVVPFNAYVETFIYGYKPENTYTHMMVIFRSEEGGGERELNATFSEGKIKYQAPDELGVITITIKSTEPCKNISESGEYHVSVFERYGEPNLDIRKLGCCGTQSNGMPIICGYDPEKDNIRITYVVKVSPKYQWRDDSKTDVWTVPRVSLWLGLSLPLTYQTGVYSINSGYPPAPPYQLGTFAYNYSSWFDPHVPMYITRIDWMAEVWRNHDKAWRGMCSGTIGLTTAEQVGL